MLIFQTAFDPAAPLTLGKFPNNYPFWFTSLTYIRNRSCTADVDTDWWWLPPNQPHERKYPLQVSLQMFANIYKCI